jgi:predicted nuclease of predicted toxin-antitoxin system
VNAGQALSLVRLLFDENLSPGLVSRLADLFPDSAHVHDYGLGATSDAAIWEFAISEGFTIVSKDWDFHDQAVLRTGRPKVIWLRMGNCSTDRLEELLRSFSPAIEHFNADPASTLLMLP